MDQTAEPARGEEPDPLPRLPERPVSFDPVEGLRRLDELARLTAPPAGQEEICRQGVALAGTALGSQGGVVLLRWDHDSPVSVASSWGPVPVAEMAPMGELAIATSREIEEPGTGEGIPSRVAVLLPGDTGPSGALVLARPSHWCPAGRDFARAAARTLTVSLRAARTIDRSLAQGETLARRNAELEVLRDLAGRLQGLEREDEMLQAALDLVLEKLGLRAGWIFWGESRRGRLELAACRGVASDFVREARESGIGECLCLDVFATGKLRFARNTTDCPRLPDLVCGTGPMTHACIPLKFERGILGVMNIASRPGQVFSAEELQFLETVGNQVCMAVDKTRTSRAEARRNAEARALVALGRAIGGSLEQERVLAAVGDYARELLAAGRCCIFLGDGSSPLLFAYLSGPPMTGLEAGRPADIAALGSRALLEALRQRRMMVIQNANEDPRGNPDLARLWGIGAAIIVPLMAHERLAGLLFATRDRPSPWSQDEVDLADALAGQAAMAIENARLYREAQEAFLRLQQAQYGMMRAERLAAVGTLASSLAHEVRNPLNSINLQLVLMSRRLARLAEPAQAEISAFLENARREIERLNGLVEEFLSLSSIDRLSPADTHVGDVVREVIGLMAPVARLKGISVSEEIDQTLPLLRIDREKIKQALINLVRNAIEAMPDGGFLAIRAHRDDSAVIVSVSDTGVGIDAGLDVFDFFLTTKRGGTGLGLPIARRIVEAHGGTLRFESEPGRGTTFRVILNIS